MMTNELITAIEAMDPEMLGGAVLGVTAIFLAFAVVALIRYLIIAIGYSKMYRKAGVAGWKAFVPVYNTYNNYKISWDAKMFFLSAALFAATSVLGMYTEGALAVVSMAVSVALIVMVVKQNMKMVKLFGKGVGTGIALILFPGITSLVLGLGKAEFTAIAE